MANLAEAFQNETIYNFKDKTDIKASGQTHGRARAKKTDYSLSELVKEYGVLRHVILDELFPTGLYVLEYSKILHHYIDESIQSAVSEFVKHSKSAMENERHNLEDLFRNSKSFIAILKGENYIYEYVNPMHHIIVGRDAKGHTLKEIVPEAFDELIKLFERVKKGETVVVKETPFIVQGKEIFVDSIYVPWRDSNGNIEGIMTLGNDVTIEVTTRKKIEESVSKLKNERDLRERFVAALTHDLRTPLTAARMGAQLILRQLPDSELAQKLGGRIVSNLDRSDAMIRDLMDAGRINAGENLPLSITECVLNEIVESTLDDLASIHGDRFQLKVSEPIKGFWDPSALKRILENLVNNAVKYGSKLPIEIGLKNLGTIVEISVRNEGNPISLEDQKRIFQPYARLDSAEVLSQKGWGIGLTLVKGYTEAMGGKTKIESSLESGTTFYVCIPFDSNQK